MMGEFYPLATAALQGVFEQKTELVARNLALEKSNNLLKSKIEAVEVQFSHAKARWEKRWEETPIASRLKNTKIGRPCQALT